MKKKTIALLAIQSQQINFNSLNINFKMLIHSLINNYYNTNYEFFALIKSVTVLITHQHT